MHDYYYRGSDEDEVIIQCTGNTKCPLSIRLTDSEENSAMLNLPAEEIDRIILGLEKVREKILIRALPKSTPGDNSYLDERAIAHNAIKEAKDNSP